MEEHGGNVCVFCRERDYELLELWKSTGCSFMECGEMFEREFDLRLVEYYELYREGGTPSRQPPGVEVSHS